MDSPLLLPVKLEGKTILVLDETRLPFKEEYIKVKTLQEALIVLKEMKTRSLGQVLLCLYSFVVFGGSQGIDDICRQFKEKRPTFDFSMIGQIVKTQTEKGLKIEGAVGNFVERFDTLRREAAAKLATRLPNPAHVLTICNINGELIYLYQELKKLNKNCLFYVSETRPFLQGTRLTFWELRKNDIPCRLICDNQAAQLMKERKVNCVVTGADRATKIGDVINKIGTYALARLAKHFGIPFYAFTHYPRDVNVDSIEIEERPQEEAFMFLEGEFSGVPAFYPAFDVTSTYYVTERVEVSG